MDVVSRNIHCTIVNIQHGVHMLASVPTCTRHTAEGGGGVVLVHRRGCVNIHACDASNNYASVRMRKRGIRYIVCLCVCLCRLLQLLKDESSASKSFYRLLVLFSWILIRGFAK